MFIEKNLAYLIITLLHYYIEDASF